MSQALWMVLPSTFQEYSGNNLQYLKQSLKQNYTQNIICPYFFKKPNISPIFLRKSKLPASWKNVRFGQKVLVKAFECIKGSISPKNQQTTCICSWDIDVKKLMFFQIFLLTQHKNLKKSWFSFYFLWYFFKVAF